MRVSDFDFELPPERIALRPAVPREAARLLVVGDSLRDQTVGDLPAELRAGDVLVFNDTKVIPAALAGVRVGRAGTTPKIEVLLHQRLDAGRWKAFARPAKKLQEHDGIDFNGLLAKVENKSDSGEITLSFDVSGEALDAEVARVGQVPLPPYIESKAGDRRSGSQRLPDDVCRKVWRRGSPHSRAALHSISHEITANHWNNIRNYNTTCRRGHLLAGESR